MIPQIKRTSTFHFTGQRRRRHHRDVFVANVSISMPKTMETPTIKIRIIRVPIRVVPTSTIFSSLTIMTKKKNAIGINTYVVPSVTPVNIHPPVVVGVVKNVAEDVDVTMTTIAMMTTMMILVTVVIRKMTRQDVRRVSVVRGRK